MLTHARVKAKGRHFEHKLSQQVRLLIAAINNSEFQVQQTRPKPIIIIFLYTA